MSGALEQVDAPCPDTAATILFLESFRAGGPWHLVAIREGRGPVARTFDPGRRDEMRRWIDARQGAANLYFHVNELRPEFRDGKASKDDVATVTYLHVDIDDSDPAVLEKLNAFSPFPTAVVFSGGGYHAYWRLNEACTDLDRAERCNISLAQSLGGDSCHNVDRIMRLPGTLNIPNAKKQEKGRTVAAAYLVVDATDWSRTYAIDEFSEAEPKTKAVVPRAPTGDVVLVDVDDLPAAINDFTKTLIGEGDDPAAPIGSDSAHFKSRSEAVYRVVCDLGRAKCTDETIAGVILNPDNKISSSVLEKRDATAYAFRQVTNGKEAVATGWLDVDGKRRPRPTMRNTMRATRRLGISCEFNDFSNRKVLGGHALQEYAGELTDNVCARLRHLIIEEFKFDPGKNNTGDAANTLCLENTFHPIREYLDGLNWDGEPRIDRFLVDYMGAADTPLNRAIARKMLVAGVRRIREPGAKFDTIIVLEGPQGSGKSTALEILAGGQDNFSDADILTLDQKGQMEALEGVWIYEICELEGISRADTTKVKSFASRRVERARAAYGRFREDHPRQCILVGTTNDDKYLRDQTGNRRFWPVKTGNIDLEALRRDRDQLWAEAAYWEAKDESLILPEELWPAAAEAQEERLEDDPWLDTLAKIDSKAVGGFQRVTSESIFTTHLGLEADRQHQFQTKRVAGLMRKLGWTGPKLLRMPDGDKPARGYERPVATPIDGENL